MDPGTQCFTVIIVCIGTDRRIHRQQLLSQKKTGGSLKLFSVPAACFLDFRLIDISLLFRLRLPVKNPSHTQNHTYDRMYPHSI